MGKRRRRGAPSHPGLRRWSAVALSAAVLLVCSAAGCSSKPARVAAPSWRPDAFADEAMKMLDKDGNGQLSAEELQGAPGLKSCLRQVDTNEDGQLSRDEVRDRLALYQETRVGLTMFACGVTLDGKPLANASVKLVPEPFLGGVVKPASGTTEGNGRVQLIAEGEDFPAAQIGMYRVEITSPNVEIPAKYNSQTELGVEISPVTDPYAQGETVFELKRR